MDPDGAFMNADGGDDGAAVRLDRNALFFSGAVSDLLRITIGKALAPEMALAGDLGDEIHPRATGRPAGGCACAVRSYVSGRGGAVERDDHAGSPASCLVHL